MKERILLVDDEESFIDLLEDSITKVGDAETEVLIAGCAEEAIAIAELGDLAYCVLDLRIPYRRKGDPVGAEEGCKAAFEVLDALLRHNTDIQIRMTSLYTENPSICSIVAGYEGGCGSRILGSLNKEADEDYMDIIMQEVEGIDHLAEGQVSQKLKKMNVRVVHFLERRLVRDLWKRAGDPVERWPTPILVFRGSSRSGKDMWASVFFEFVNMRRPFKDRPNEDYDLGQLSNNSAGDSAQIDLFGSRGYQGFGDTPGLFEKVTVYHARNWGGKPFIPSSRRVAQESDKPDYNKSGAVFLSELGNLPLEYQALFLKILDDNPSRGGTINTKGRNETIRIGCMFLFTTNADIESRVATSHPPQPGQLREDLFLRLKKALWIFVPDIKDMGFSAVRAHLCAALDASRPPILTQGNHKEFDAGSVLSDLAMEHLRNKCDEQHPGLNAEAIHTMAQNYWQEAVHRKPTSVRFRAEHVTKAIEISGAPSLSAERQKRRAHMQQPMEPFTEGTAEYHIADMCVSNSGLGPTTAEISKSLADASFPFSPSALTKMIGEVRRKLRSVGIKLSDGRKTGGRFRISEGE